MYVKYYSELSKVTKLPISEFYPGLLSQTLRIRSLCVAIWKAPQAIVTCGQVGDVSLEELISPLQESWALAWLYHGSGICPSVRFCAGWPLLCCELWVPLVTALDHLLLRRTPGEGQEGPLSLELVKPLLGRCALLVLQDG